MHRSATARRVQAGVLTAWAVYALGGTPAWAAASDAPRVTLAPLGADTGLEKAATKFGQLLGDELKTREDDIRWAAFPKTVAAPGGASKKEKASIREAADALAQGQQLMDDLKFEDAVAALKKGIELAEADPASADFKEIDYALVRMAAGYVRMGEEKKAQQALFQVARLNPEYQLPEGQFPPVFKHEFEKAQKRAEKSAKGTVAIDGPSGSTAFLNGRDLGLLPVSQDNVAVGMNYVRVEGAHGERFGQAVEVKATGARVRAAFSGGGAAAAAVVAVELHVGSSLQPDTATRAAQICRALDAEFMVVGYVSRGSERRLYINSAIYSAHRQGFAKLKRFEFDEEVLTANVEAFQLADEIVSRVKAFESPDALPLSLTGEAPVVVAKATPTEVRKPTKTPSDAAVTPLVPKDKKEEGGAKVRALDRRSELVDARADGSTVDENEHKTIAAGGGVPWWVWVVAGAGVAAAAGGGAFAYSQANRPVTGSAGFSWSH